MPMSKKQLEKKQHENRDRAVELQKIIDTSGDKNAVAEAKRELEKIQKKMKKK